ncbi:MAG: recombinase zinc beta ribbon domain-containing protein [Rhodospirillaceae bacterium]
MFQRAGCAFQTSCNAPQPIPLILLNRPVRLFRKPLARQHCGSAMTPSHTRRRGRLYRYYTCTSAIKQGHAACPVRSLAAGEAETLVLAQVRHLLRSPEIAARTLAASAGSDAVTEPEIIEALACLDTVWDSLFPTEQQRLLHLLVEQVGVTTESLKTFHGGSQIMAALGSR